MQHSGELGSLACSAPHPLLLCLSMSKDVSLRKTLEVTRTSQYLKSHRIFSFGLVFVKSSLGLGFSVVLCFLQSFQRTASGKDHGVGWSCSQSAGRAGTGVFNRHVRRSPLHTNCTTTAMHTHTTTASCDFTIHTYSAYCRTRLSAALPFTKISRQYSQSHNLSLSGQTTQRARTMTGCY